MRLHTRCPSIYNTQEAEPQSDPAHIIFILKDPHRFPYLLIRC